jgi:hypothetical protein
MVTSGCLLTCQVQFITAIPEQTTSSYTSDELPDYFTDTSFFKDSGYGTMRPDFFSNAEGLLMMRAGRKIDLKKLILEYSKICPIQHSCGVDFEGKYLFTGNIKDSPAFKGILS